MEMSRVIWAVHPEPLTAAFVMVTGIVGMLRCCCGCYR